VASQFKPGDPAWIRRKVTPRGGAATKCGGARLPPSLTVMRFGRTGDHQTSVQQILAQPPHVRLVRELLEPEAVSTRSALARELCQRLDLRDPNGGWRLATTLKALRDLEAQGFWTLPAATVPPPGAWNPTRLHRRVQTHRTQTIRRMRKEPTVLILQDTTELNFSTRSACEGLGQSGTNQTGAQSRGLDGRGTC